MTTISALLSANDAPTISTRNRLFLSGVMFAALALPFVVSGYAIFQATQVLVFGIAILGLNLLTGYNGQISIGHGAFYAIGGYTTAILIHQFGLPYWATIPAAALVCFAVGFLVGLPALRLEPLYLALVTLSLALVTPQVLKSQGVAKWTGGVQGLLIDKPSAPAALGLNQDQWIYLLVLGCAALLTAMAHNLVRGRIGRALNAIREQPIAADTMGIDTALYKTLTFGISAMYTGIAGALAALMTQFVSPDSYPFFLSVTLLVGSVVGGIASITGALVGALFIVFIPNVAENISKSAPWAVYGVFLIGFMFVMPQGVVGLFKRIQARYQPT